jgi:hypothetical protein
MMAEVVTRMKGLGIIELISEMYPRMLRYVHAFERHPRFREQMALQGQSNDEFFAGLDNPGRAGSNLYRPWSDLMQPVETQLAAANLGRQCYDNSLFKSHRKGVTDALEEQYKPISLAAKTISAVTRDRQTWGLYRVVNTFDMSYAHSYTSNQLRFFKFIDEAMKLLRQYAKSFERIMLDNIANAWGIENLRGMEGPLSNYYALLPVNLKIDRLEKAIKFKDYTDFKPLYREIVDGLDKYYFEIKTARKELFQSDKEVSPEEMWFGIGILGET